MAQGAPRSAMIYTCSSRKHKHTAGSWWHSQHGWITLLTSLYIKTCSNFSACKQFICVRYFTFNRYIIISAVSDTFSEIFLKVILLQILIPSLNKFWYFTITKSTFCFHPFKEIRWQKQRLTLSMMGSKCTHFMSR